MKNILILLLLFHVLTFIQCTTKENNKGADNTGKRESPDQTISHKTSIPVPDVNTFFPLISQSAWHYEQFMEGTLEPGSSLIDSVAEVNATDSGLLCKMIRTENGAQEEFSYLVKADSTVVLIDKSGVSKKFCLLFPISGQKVDDLVYSKFKNDDNTRIYLETSDYETSTDEQRMSWQAQIFDKGIGLTSFGGNESNMLLTEYHIGNGPIIKTGR